MNTVACPSHIGGRVQDLSLEVGLVHPVEIQDPERAHPRSRQVHRNRRAETARPDHQDLRIEQLELALSADPWKDDVTGVPPDLVLGEGRAHWIVSSSSATSPSVMRNARTTGLSRSDRDTSR